MPKAKLTTPYQKAWSACDPVNSPTRGGSTGMIRPIDTMSISTVIMMKGMAALRRRCPSGVVVNGSSTGRDSAGLTPYSMR